MKDRRSRRKRRHGVATGALAVGAALGAAATSEAATFPVTSNADSGPNTLRQAVIDANGAAGADTITFNASLTGSTITLTTGQIDITDAVDIQGLGSANLTVSGNDASRIFYVYHPAVTPIDVTISGLTLTDGHSVLPGDPSGSSGGAIRTIGESLTLDDVNITSSVAAGDGGGVAHLAIDNTSEYNAVPATLTISNSTIDGNAANFIDLGIPVDAGGCGGGVFSGGAIDVLLDNVTLTNNDARCDGGGFAGIYMQPLGEITIQNSVITGNSAGVDGEGGIGGGIAVIPYSYNGSVSIVDTTVAGNDASSGGGIASLYLFDLAIQRSTISGNTAGDGGGGILTVITYGTIENSTIAENDTSYYGGGMYNVYSYMTVKETTISGNTAAYEGPGIYAYGASEITIHNSIVANNIGNTVYDLAGDSESFFDVSYSLIENPGTAPINDNGGNIFGVDPMLGALQDNGGPTFTMKPDNASQVVDAGDPAFTPPPSTDQRGFAREVGTAIDMGAVELNPGTVQFTIAAQNVNENAGTATVTASRTGGTDGPASVTVSVDGASTATGGGVDYTFGGTVLNWADNDGTSQSFNITIVDDPSLEPPETIVLTLGAPTGAALGATTTHTATILDNDVASANLDIDKILAPGSLTQGATATFVLTATNNGPDPAPNVTVTDSLPPEVTFVSATPSAGSCSGTTTITCNVGTLINGASATVDVVVTLTTPGSTTNTAGVASDVADPDTSDNSTDLTFTIAALDADLSIEKTLLPGPLTLGSNATFVLTVTNDGPDPATNVTVTDTLPPEVSYVSATPSAGSCSGTATITCNVGTLNDGESATIDIVVTLNTPGDVTNTAGVASDTADSDGSDNSSDANFTIAAPANADIPALDPRTQMLLAALIAAVAVALLAKK